MQAINSGCESVYNNKKAEPLRRTLLFVVLAGRVSESRFCENGLFNSLFHKTRNTNSTDGCRNRYFSSFESSHSENTALSLSRISITYSLLSV